MSTKRKLNIELLKRLRMRFLRMRHRKHFNMSDIAVKTECGAAMCIAGHTLELAGYRRRFNEESYGNVYDWFTPSGRKLDSSRLLDVAQGELGLTYEQAQLVDYDDHKNSGLFFRYDLRTPKQAAKLIQKVIDSPMVLPGRLTKTPACETGWGGVMYIRPRTIRLRYRDRVVLLTSDTDNYGTMTQTDDYIEFDFSNCRVIGTEPVSSKRLHAYYCGLADNHEGPCTVIATRMLGI